VGFLLGVVLQEPGVVLVILIEKGDVTNRFNEKMKNNDTNDTNDNDTTPRFCGSIPVVSARSFPI
jgi:hypothetical protein